MNRRTFLHHLAVGAAAAAASPVAFAERGRKLPAADDALLDDLSHRCFQFFWNESDPHTGITRDRTRANGGPIDGSRADAGSTGATGFSLTALCIGAERGWVARSAARERVRATLRAYVEGPVESEHGWFYHFVDVRTGRRSGPSEMSTSDATWLLAGALTARSYFNDDPVIGDLATRLYHNVDYRWMCNGHPYLLSHGWRPETGHIKFRYEKYCQLAAMYLLGVGAPGGVEKGHALPPDAWYAWQRNPAHYGHYDFIGGTLLWTYQFPFAWFDLRGMHDGRDSQLDLFRNAEVATRAHRDFCQELNARFPGCYTENVWGITSSITRHGYKAWGGPPAKGPLDGTVVPCASAGSLMLIPDICLPAVRELKARFGSRIYRRYGFVDAFHPVDGWTTDDVIGIDVGITLLAAENLRTGSVWQWFMANPEPRRALRLAQFSA